MGLGVIEGITLTPLKIIELTEGDVSHCMKNGDVGYQGFGEVYFSHVKPTLIKAWKLHRAMTLNLAVPVGSIKFVIFDDRPKSKTRDTFFEVILSRDNYMRLTVPPLLWVGFQGVGRGENMLVNFADLPHDPAEAERRDIHSLIYNWGT